MKGQARFLELERKFGKTSDDLKGIHAYSIVSPIKQEAGERMTDEQWLRAISKRSDAWELAGLLGEFVAREPERFARLSLQFPPNTNPDYLERVVCGLSGSAASSAIKLSVCRKAFNEARVTYGKAISNLLGSIEDSLPHDAYEMLHWLATEHPDPEKELWEVDAGGGQPYYGGSISFFGLNTARGSAALAIGKLVCADRDYVSRFSKTIEMLSSDRSLGVLSCVTSMLVEVAHSDFELAVRHFFSLAATDDRLLAMSCVERFIYNNLAEHFFALRPLVQRMLESLDPEVSRAGARLASLAALDQVAAADGLVSKAMHGHAAQRHGVAEVAAANISLADYRIWCESHLRDLFNDHDTKVRGEAASCFRHLGQASLEGYSDLIAFFCDSLAYQEDSSSLLRVLEQSSQRLPGTTCLVCEKFLARFSEEAKDIRTHRAGDVHMVVKLILRTYHQHQRDEWASRCLDLIDRLCLEGIHEVSAGLKEFER